MNTTNSKLSTGTDILIISPWNTEGGIATYSQYLIPHLRNYSNVHIFAWDFDSFLKRGFGLPFIRKEFVKKIRRSNVIHIQYTPSLYFLSLPVLILLSKVTRTKVVLTQHERFGNLPMSSFVFLYHQFIYFFLDQIIVHTNHRRDLIWSVHHRRISVIEHGIINRSEFDRSPSTIDMILLPGQIRTGKGYHFVIKSLKEIDSNLRIVGSVANKKYFSYLEKVSTEQKTNNRIQWVTEFVPEEQLFKELREADLVVLPYESDTAMSGILCHCISWKIPTILSDVPAFRHMVSYEDVFLKNRSSKSIVQKIQEFKSKPEKQREAIKQFEKISSESSWKKVSKATTRLYINLLN